MKSDSEPRYPIGAVARLTGIGLDTLRAWERRHQAVTPTRDERGRLYSEDDIQRLRLLRDAVERGHPIGRIAALPAEQLTKLAAGPRPAAQTTARSESLVDIAALLDALRRFDTAAVEASLGRAAAILRPAELLRDVIMPVLVEIGEAWCSNQASVAHEHLVSASIRNVLGLLLRFYKPRRGAARLVFATPSGERHELGVLGAAILAASGGLDVVYLGPDLPPADIVDCATVVGTDVVALGVTGAVSVQEAARQVAAIAHALPRDVELWLGGLAAPAVNAESGGRALVVGDYDALETQLARVGAEW